MAVARVKCLFCEQYFDRNKIPNVKIGNRYAHKECYDAQSEETLQNKKDEGQFFSFVKKIYGTDYNYKMIETQAKRMMKDYGYTWSGMAGTLYWFYIINKGSIEDGNGGIGIIPYVYDEAKKYFERIARVEESNKMVKNMREPVCFSIQSPRAWQRPPQLLNLDDD